MVKLSPGVWMLIAAAGALALVALLPVSRWIVLNQVDQLLGRPGAQGLSPLYHQDEAFDYVSGQTGPDAELIAAIDAEPVEGLHVALLELARKLDDPEIWAHVIRFHGFRLAPPPPDNEADAARLNRIVASRRAALREAAQAGTKLDPHNALFPFAEAQVCWYEGDRNEALRKLEAGGHAARYEEYLLEEYRARVALLEAKLGYRGEYVRLGVAAGLMLPHMAGYREFGREIQAHGTDEEKRALVQFAELMARHVQTGIGLIIADSIALDAIYPVGSSGKDRSDHRLSLRYAAALDSGDGQIVAQTRWLNEIREQYMFERPNISDDEYGILTFQDRASLFGLAMMASLAMILLVGATGWRLGRTRILRPPPVNTPALCATVAWLFALTVLKERHVELTGWTSLPALFGFLIFRGDAGRWLRGFAAVLAGVSGLLGFLFLYEGEHATAALTLAGAAILLVTLGRPSERADQTARSLAIVVVALCAASAIGAPINVIPALVYGLVSLGTRGEAGTERSLRHGAMVTLCAVCGGLVFVAMLLNSPDTGMRWLAAAGVTLVFSGVLFWGRRLTLAPFAAGVLVLTAGYVIAAGVEVRHNSAVGALNERFLNEAEHIRARMAGQRP
jgi:hypothetical protein